MTEQDMKRNTTPLPKANIPFCTQCFGNEYRGHDGDCIIVAMQNIIDDLDVNRQAEIVFPNQEDKYDS